MGGCLIDRALFQGEFLALVRITQQAVSDLQRRGVLKLNATGQAWLIVPAIRLRAPDITADMFANVEPSVPLPAPADAWAPIEPAPSPTAEPPAVAPNTITDALMWSAPRGRRVRGVSA